MPSYLESVRFPSDRVGRAGVQGPVRRDDRGTDVGRQDAVIAVRGVLVRLGKRSGLNHTRLISTEIDATPLLDLPVIRRHARRSGLGPEETAVSVIRALVQRLPPTERIIADATLALGTLVPGSVPGAGVDLDRLYAAELGERREYLSRYWQALHDIVRARPQSVAPTVRQLRARLERGAYTELAQLLVDATDYPEFPCQPGPEAAQPGPAAPGRTVTVIGDAVIEHRYRVERLPAPGEFVRGRAGDHVGGKGLGRVVAAARLGLNARLMCAIGDDQAGEGILTYLRTQHVDTGLVTVVAGAATPLDARMITGSGAAAEIHCRADRIGLAVADLHTAQARHALAESDAVLLTLEQPMPVVEAALATLDALPGRPQLILHATPAVTEPQGLYRYLPVLDYLIGTEPELRALVPGADIDTVDPVLYLRMLGARAICVLDGGHCRVITDDLDLRLSLSPAFLLAGAGAHAAFSAALAYRLLRSRRPPTDHDFRFAAAAMVAAQSFDDTPDAMPTLDRIDRVLTLHTQHSSA
ncbi:hypothetical protein F6W96_19925 [Nocardia terpenica]|uniref:Carbohydrate kinase PfkB domain-containing protein n=1 Tax=Nocardia terpenica TaxID=455432 RepID=A0A6G9Z460_9NOCA|nr:hypothetical protein F6W96_19925 [Nocardia terpenica]